MTELLHAPVSPPPKLLLFSLDERSKIYKVSSWTVLGNPFTEVTLQSDIKEHTYSPSPQKDKVGEKLKPRNTRPA